MSIYIDKKFLSYVSPRLENYKQKSDYLWNFRCPFCGDSKKNKLKSRAYIYRGKSDLFFTCHNCGRSMAFGTFLKEIDRGVYDEYRMERFKNESHGNVKQPDLTVYKVKPVFHTTINLPTITSLPPDHFAKQFLIRRKVPAERLNELYYAHDFALFVNELVPSNDKDLISNDSRIVIPFYDENKNLLGVQGRELKKTGVKYITIKLSETNRKVFGLDKLDVKRRIYVFEGPIDSMFIPNSIGMMDASLENVYVSVGDHDYVLVYDNEPRNGAIVRHMEKAISMGHNVVVWPQHVTEKDVNDMIIAGRLASEVQYIIDNNTYTDLKARMEFNAWKRV